MFFLFSVLCFASLIASSNSSEERFMKRQRLNAKIKEQTEALKVKEISSWKDNYYIRNGRYHVSYQCCVLVSKAYADPSSLAQRYCNQESAKHRYELNFDLLSYRVSGYSGEEGKNEYFNGFVNTFERYCHLPADGFGQFYRQYPRLRIFSYIPGLQYLIPYWVKGDIVQEIAVETLKHWLPLENGFSNSNSCYSRYPDIPINVLYNDNDPVVTEEDAKVICAQLAKTGEFPNVRLVRVSLDKDGKLVLEPQEFDPASISDVAKSYEKRQWWLQHMWVSKLIVSLSLLALFITFGKGRECLVEPSFFLLQALWER